MFSDVAYDVIYAIVMLKIYKLPIMNYIDWYFLSFLERLAAKLLKVGEQQLDYFTAFCIKKMKWSSFFFKVQVVVPTEVYAKNCIYFKFSLEGIK